MKIRTGFVSNSSSSSFIIKNKTEHKVSLIKLVEENPQFIEEYREEYSDEQWTVKRLKKRYPHCVGTYTIYSQQALLESMSFVNEILDPYESREFEFADQGQMYDYVFHAALRGPDESESFEWELHESHH